MVCVCSVWLKVQYKSTQNVRNIKSVINLVALKTQVVCPDHVVGQNQSILVAFAGHNFKTKHSSSSL